MKIIMLRDLDENPEIVRIVRAYMARPRVATKAAIVAVESLIRQFDRNEKDSFEYRQRTGQELHELRDEVTRLTWDRGVDVRNINAFRAAFKDLMSDSWGILYVADSRLRPTTPTVLATPMLVFYRFQTMQREREGRLTGKARPYGLLRK